MDTLVAELLNLAATLGREPPEAGDLAAVAGQIRDRIERIRGFDDDCNRRVRDNRFRHPADVARGLHEASVDLVIAERPVEGVRAARLAVEVCRQHVPGELADALEYLAGVCSAEGHDEDALAAASEAVVLNRRPGTGPVELARSLDRSAAALARLARAAEARDALRESARLRRATPPVYGHPGLVAALTVAVRLALCDTDGMDAERATAFDEVARRYREIREDSDGDRLAALADTLSSVVLRLADRVPVDHAVPALLDAEEMIPELDDSVEAINVEGNPAADHTPKVHVLCFLVDRFGPRQETATAHEAVEELLKLTDSDHERYLDAVADRLRVLASWLLSRGDVDLAVALVGHEVELRRWMASGNDDLYPLYRRWRKRSTKDPVEEWLAAAVERYEVLLRGTGGTTGPVPDKSASR